ncbi:hypothetical protein N7474_005998 [Penicillium riverlandense]|uniref:uncharacterized protein n=1 Tax=Penicillium riverlandense TaxID=1903569 RepID=UPI0025473494|nr:uncharacterized protein N7474_005998 [Penicillium riverlandense]KAJ5820407.1 hypothetical protein N7474_005998 [Penicillium riverlandense]
MPQTAEDHVKLLLCCIKHCYDRHIDFQEVSTELGLPSRAAAAKRYTRLLKAHGMDTMGMTIGRAEKPAVSSADRTTRGLEVDREGHNWDQLFSKVKHINTSPIMGCSSAIGPQHVTNDQGGHREDAHFHSLGNKEARYKTNMQSIADVQNVAKNPPTIVIPAKAILSRQHRAVIVIDDEEDSDATICYGSDMSPMSHV